MKSVPNLSYFNSYVIIVVILLMTGSVVSQVGINKDGSSPSASSILDVKGTSGKHLLVNDANGFVGLGTTSPNTLLNVNSGVTEDPFRVQVNGNSKLYTLKNGGTGMGAFTASLPDDGLYVSGNVGIGTNTPDSKLEVSGQIKITGGAPGVDKVLTSDANGLAEWAAPAPPPPPTYAIGDFVEGGVVFWLTPNAQHGKVICIYNFKGMKWSNITATEVGATGEMYNFGAGNSVAITQQDGHERSAASMCMNLAYGGYDDWYLPSKNEMNDVGANKAIIVTTSQNNGGDSFVFGFYWTSMEVSGTDKPTHAWAKNMDGTLAQASKTKTSKLHFRAVRAF